MQARYRVLVAEDDQDVRDLIRTHLGISGFDVHTARNGAEALSAAMRVKPHAMILDINMPEVDGFSVLKSLKAQGYAFPVMVLTARHASADVRMAVSLGAKDYLTKPFTEAQLQGRVARLLRAHVSVPPISAN